MQPSKPWDGLFEWLNDFMRMGSGTSPLILILLIVAAFLALFVMIYPSWRITSKAGFSGWWSILTLVPFLNIAFVFFLALAPWPALTERSVPRQ